MKDHAPIRSEGAPVDRLTRMCERLTSAMEADPEYLPADRAVIMISSVRGDGKYDGGLVTTGYDSDVRAIVDVIEHVKALWESVTGHKLMLVLPELS